jgi:hypothetical protein
VPQTDALDLNARPIRALELLSRESRWTTEVRSQWNRVSRATAQRDLAAVVGSFRPTGPMQKKAVGTGLDLPVVPSTRLEGFRANVLVLCNRRHCLAGCIGLER